MRDRGHDLRRQEVERRRDQHVHRGPALPERREQRAGHALRPSDRQVQGPDVHLRGQQRPGREHRGRPVGRDDRGQRRRLHHRRDLAVQLRVVGARPRHGQPAPVLVGGSPRGRGVQTRHRGAGRGNLHHSTLAAGRAGCRDICPSAGLRHVQRDLDGRPTGGRCRCAPGQRGQGPGVPHKPEQLRQAIRSTTRYMPDYGAHEQGNGLLQVDDAWDLLKKASRRSTSARRCR